MSEEIIGFYNSTNSYNRIEKNALYLMEQLKERGNNVVAFTSENSPLNQSLRELSIEVLNADETKKYINLILSFRLARALKKINCNILIILRPHDLITAILTKIIFYRKLKLIFFQQIKLRLRRSYLLYSILFRPFDRWFVSMEHFKKQLVLLSNYPKEKIVTITPVIDPDYYAVDTISQGAARKILRLPQKISMIGVLGRHHKNQSQDFLIRAIQLLRKHDYSVDLMVMGTSEEADEKKYFTFLNELAIECKVENHIHFRPYTEKDITFFNAIDIYAHLSPEGLNGKHLLRAMASKKPVVARDDEDMKEILQNGKYGMLYKKNDLEDFTAKIIHLITQPKIRDHIIREANNVVQEKYNIRIQLDKFELAVNTLTKSQ